MYVRLAFAVAAFLEPEILIIDEVLAVGDAEFQKKCLGRMKDVSLNDGRTVLFVSHNMSSVKSLCNLGLVLKNGHVDFDGKSDEAVKFYLGAGMKSINTRQLGYGRDGFLLEEISISNTGKIGNDSIERHLEIEIRFSYRNENDHPGIYLNTKYKDDEGKYFMVTTSNHVEQNLKKGHHQASLFIPPGFFNEGTFSMDVMVIGKDKRGYQSFFSEKDVLMFQIIPDQKDFGMWMGKEVGQVIPEFEWKI